MASPPYGGSSHKKGNYLLESYVQKSKKLKQAAVYDIKQESKNYAKGESNFVRSLGVLYASGIASKRKYIFQYAPLSQCNHQEN